MNFTYIVLYNKLYDPLQSAYIENCALQKQHWLKLRMTLWCTNWTKAIVWRYFC